MHASSPVEHVSWSRSERRLSTGDCGLCVLCRRATCPQHLHARWQQLSKEGMLLEVCCLALDLSRAATLTLLPPQREVELEGVSAPAVCRVAPTSAGRCERPAVCRVTPTSSAGNPKNHLAPVCNMQTHGNAVAYNMWLDLMHVHRAMSLEASSQGIVLV